MKPGIVLTDETREIVAAYLEKQRKRIAKRIAKRQEEKPDKEWIHDYLKRD